MSDARWCDFRDHPYRAGRAGTVMFGRTEQVPNQWGGQQPSTTNNVKEICPECAAELGLTEDYVPEVSPAERKGALMEQLQKHKGN